MSYLVFFTAIRTWTVYIGIVHVYIIEYEKNSSVDYRNLDYWRMPPSLSWPVLSNVSNQPWVMEISIHRSLHDKRSRSLTLPLTDSMAWMLEMTGVKLS